MQIFLSGIGSETLLTDFDSSGIEYIQRPPDSGVVMNAGETIQLIKDISEAIPWEAIAAVIIAWLKYRPSRKIIATTKDNKVVHIEGMDKKEFTLLLPSCKNLMVIETSKADNKKPIKHKS